ncbi:MAG: hypothetical protein HC817_15910, partial [Saprospiraceae bacterium]|nr:hypothetical protein [Saprospiraceae bacterium]
MYGTTVYGYGSGDAKANLTMNDARRGNRNFRAAASLIAIKKGENIVGERVEAVIYFGKDSIYHPSVNLKLDIKKDELTLERGQRGGDRNPFYDSFHKMTIDVGKVKFDFAKDSLILGDKNATFSINNTKGIFESFQYYSERDFDGFQGVATFNPISRIKIYSDNNNKRRTFSAEEFAKGVSPKLDSVSVQSMLYNLVAGGFINYDVDKQTVELKDKLFHFAAANQKKADFDPLRMISESKQGNGSFSLRDTNLNVNGVRMVDLSVKQRVRVTPKGEEMTLKRNRDFDFNGKLTAGFGVFFGRDYHFNYDKYEIKTDSARFLDLYLPVGIDKYGNPSARVINSRIEHLKGVLLIDAPNNKSGREDIKMFPSFQSKDVSYVFYDDASIHDSIYNRDNFYFKLDKFNLDAMDSLSGKDLNFKGLFRSNDIFPDFRETLSLQKDSSLGLITKSPTEGYALYKGKGNYTGEIDLSNKGLLGRGSVKYLGASIESQDVLFYPNEMKSTAKKFHLEEDRVKNVPQIEGPGVTINWQPYQDSMYLTAQDSAFRFFKAGVHTLRSTIIMTPGGVKGIGTFNWDKGTLTSKMFSFGAYSVAADTMNMSIRALNNQAAADLEAFNTKNIKGKIDFDEQRGRFKANSNDIQTFMPGVKYKTSINEFEWDLKEEDIDFKSDGREAAFLCVDPEQDSLRFFGTRA